MIEFEKKTWYDSSDSRAIPISPTNLNRIETCLDESVNAINEIKPYYVKACDLSNVLTTLSPGSTWTATEDCWISFYVSSATGGYSASLRVDDKTIFSMMPYTNTSNHYESLTLPPCFFAKAGSVISLVAGGNSYGHADSTIYGCLK